MKLLRLKFKEHTQMMHAVADLQGAGIRTLPPFRDGWKREWGAFSTCDPYWVVMIQGESNDT
jgi:hypothetical protein